MVIGWLWMLMFLAGICIVDGFPKDGKADYPVPYERRLSDGKTFGEGSLLMVNLASITGPFHIQFVTPKNHSVAGLRDDKVDGLQIYTWSVDGWVTISDLCHGEERKECIGPDQKAEVVIEKTAAGYLVFINGKNRAHTPFQRRVTDGADTIRVSGSVRLTGFTVLLA